MVATRPSSAWDRYAWVAGILFVVALAAETVVASGLGVSLNDSAAKIAKALYVHRERLLVIAYLSVVYAAMFPIYLSRLYNLLRGDTARTRALVRWCWLAECSLLPCMPSATSGSPAWSARNSRRSGLSTTRAWPTGCT